MSPRTEEQLIRSGNRNNHHVHGNSLADQCDSLCSGWSARLLGTISISQNFTEFLSLVTKLHKSQYLWLKVNRLLYRKISRKPNNLVNLSQFMSHVKSRSRYPGLESTSLPDGSAAWEITVWEAGTSAGKHGDVLFWQGTRDMHNGLKNAHFSSDGEYGGNSCVTYV